MWTSGATSAWNLRTNQARSHPETPTIKHENGPPLKALGNHEPYRDLVEAYRNSIEKPYRKLHTWLSLSLVSLIWSGDSVFLSIPQTGPGYRIADTEVPQTPLEI